jgi:hypothetical protein
MAVVAAGFVGFEITWAWRCVCRCSAVERRRQVRHPWSKLPCSEEELADALAAFQCDVDANGNAGGARPSERHDGELGHRCLPHSSQCIAHARAVGGSSKNNAMLLAMRNAPTVSKSNESDHHGNLAPAAASVRFDRTFSGLLQPPRSPPEHTGCAPRLAPPLAGLRQARQSLLAPRPSARADWRTQSRPAARPSHSDSPHIIGNACRV